MASDYQTYLTYNGKYLTNGSKMFEQHDKVSLPYTSVSYFSSGSPAASYTFTVTSSNAWVLEEINTGFDVNWVSESATSGVNGTTITITVARYKNGTETRNMIIRLTCGGASFDMTVYQSYT